MQQSNYQFVSANANDIVTRLTASYEKMCGITVQPASPERLFILWIADVIIQVYAAINTAANQNIPSRAAGNNLDALAELVYSTSRPSAKPSSCSMRFSISEAQLTAILIPAGTRVTDANRTLIWATERDKYIEIGDTYADVSVRCETPGVVGNGYVAGQINTAIDIFPYYSACTNITSSDGGADVATDEEFYNILRASQDAYSTAGPVGAYEYLAKSVSTEIADVKVVRPKRKITKTLTLYDNHAFLGGDNLDINSLSGPGVLDEDYTVSYEDGLLDIYLIPGSSYDGDSEISISIDSVDAGKVNIYALMQDGNAAGTEIKARILAACNADDVRPLTDVVSVEDPATTEYNIELKYFLSKNSTLSATEIQAAAESAVNEYIAWQCAKLGRDINPSKLISLVMQAGVKRVVITQPVFTELSDGSNHAAPKLAVIGTTKITAGGYEDE